MHSRISINNKDLNMLYVSLTKIDEEFSTMFHSHPNMEVILITDGEGFVKTTNHNYELKKGDLVILNSNSNHLEYTNSSITFYAIGLNNMAVFLKDNFAKRCFPLKLSKEEFALLLPIFNAVYQEAKNLDDSSINILQSSLNIIVSIIERHACNTNNSSSTDSDLISNIKTIIDNSYTTEIKISSIATRFNMSVSSICHIFKEKTGMTIIEYKLNKQLEEADNLLSITSMRIADIASLVGFNNVSYFNKQYKKKYNYSPNEKRNKK